MQIHHYIREIRFANLISSFRQSHKKHLLHTLFMATNLFLVSCTKDENNTIPSAGEYLPMQVQNNWEFQNNLKTAITGTKIIDGNTYYIFEQGSDTSYYRNAADKIYVRRSSGPESVKFDLTANSGGEWEFEDGGTTWIVKLLSKTDTVTVNNTKIPNCYRFFFNIPLAVDDEHDIYLAPGIGFIKMTCGECLYPSINLRKANINNTEITFP